MNTTKKHLKTNQMKGKEILNQVIKEGMSTDYCYSPNFYKWAKEMAINRAKSNYKEEELEEIIKEIENS